MLTAAVIGFIEGFAADPILDYPWGLPIVGALLGSGFDVPFGLRTDQAVTDRRRVRSTRA